MSENKTIQFGIREIKELEFFVDEWKDIDGSFDFNYNVDIFPETNVELLRIVITANYLKTSSKELFLKGKVLTSFFIKDMKTYARKHESGQEGIDIPEPVWVTLFSIAFTHARAILARSAAGTKFSGLLMPVINPPQEFRKLFGKFLGAETT